MRLTLLLILVLVVLAAFVDAGKKNKMGKEKKNRGEKRKYGKQRDSVGRRDCPDWVWGDCVPTEGECGLGTKKATRDGADCKVISKIKRCRVPCEGDRRKKACKYAIEEISDCDDSTGTRTATLRLKKGDPDTCVGQKSVTKNCKDRKGKRACRYSRGQWGLCDTLTNTRVRLDTLIAEHSNTTACSEDRIVVKKCGFACKYAFEDWGQCDEVKKTRSREGVLTRKKGITPADCQEKITQTRNCYNRKGVEKCFFGPWENFRGCVDGKRTKSRPLLAGGQKCQKKATITRNCK